jgi:REP element-mobilizing transposase RayT
MSRNYKFHNSKGLYFVSFAVVGWLAVFTRNEYKDLVIESLEFCQKNKGMEIHAWCIMTNHVHLIFRSIKEQNPALLLGDFKRFTSRSITKAIQDNPQESRKEFLLDFFKNETHKSSNTNNNQFWRHDNKPIELWSTKVIQQKTAYIHNNPVKEGIVCRPEYYKYSSASDYSHKPHERIRAASAASVVYQYFKL